MSLLNVRLDDTIVAPATAPGGSIAVIRLSGKDAIAICDKIVEGKSLLEKPSHSVHFVKLMHHGQWLDEAVATIFRNPKSYTGEDVVELSLHGSTYIVEKVLDALLQEGARMARPGEFTQRAFLNGKMDLSQAEAVADLIAANHEGAHSLAHQQLRGAYSNELKDLREQLIWFASLLELELDFSQEDVEFADRTQMENLVNVIGTKVKSLLQSFKLGNVLKKGVPVAIIGMPNAGKSTLLNALLKEDRAIVSDIAGTTRDTIEEEMNVDGVLFRFIDTAGLRKSEDTIEQIGVERSLAKMQQAEVVIYVMDPTQQDKQAAEDAMALLPETEAKKLIVMNKVDCVDGNTLRELSWGGEVVELVSISAKGGEGIDALKQYLYAMVISDGQEQEGIIVSNLRHVDSLQQTAYFMEQVELGLEGNLPSDLIAHQLRHALHHLGMITGHITNEDLLDTIFSKFCIGK
jgi:tRNA modification GTPase